MLWNCLALRIFTLRRASLRANALSGQSEAGNAVADMRLLLAKGQLTQRPSVGRSLLMFVDRQLTLAEGCFLLLLVRVRPLTRGTGLGSSHNPHRPRRASRPARS